MLHQLAQKRYFWRLVVKKASAWVRTMMGHWNVDVLEGEVLSLVN